MARPLSVKERWCGVKVDQNKELVQRQFGRSAAAYRDAPLFFAGTDLVWMVEAAQLKGTESLLDLGSGAGHSTLAFSRLVKNCVGLDVTAEMVQVATALAVEKGFTNVEFVQGDVEVLPFPSHTFEVVTCRFAAHHFWDVEKSMAEIARVLKPGGKFLLIDHYAPQDWELDYFVNTLDRTRDPSHVREYTLTQWESYFTGHQLSFKQHKLWDLKLDFVDWVQRAKTPPDKQAELAVLLQSATPEGKETFQIELNSEGQPQSFCLKCVLLVGAKSSL